ncbi:16095_t:CDS:2, partial [Gigaspora rosea]
YPTIRYPISNNENQYVTAYVPKVFRPGPPLEIVRLAHFASFETTHDAFHIIFGGPGGHMDYADLAGFDPIFNLYHASIDSLFCTLAGS